MKALLRNLKNRLDPRHQRTVSVRGVRITMRTRTVRERERVNAYASKEPFTLDWIDAYVKPGDVFWDVGANIGQYALYAALARQADVYAFEPLPANVQACRANFMMNGLSVGQAFTMALSNEDRPWSALVVAGDGEAGSALHEVDLEHRGILDVRSVDSLVRQGAMRAPAHLKIDTDGHELRVLEGARETLASGAVRSVMVEDGQDVLEVRLLLESCGLRRIEQGDGNSLYERQG